MQYPRNTLVKRTLEVNLGKSVLLIGYNFSPELTGIGKYSGEMVQWLAKKGYACTVLTTYPYYPHWKVQHPYRKNRFWFKKEVISHPQQGKVTIYRCPIYVPALPSGKKRMLLDLSFFVSAMIPLLKLIWSKKFDSVITIAPSFQLGFLGLLYKTFRKANHIYHIQDLQIEVARDLGMIRSPRIIRILLRLEKFIMEHSEVVSSISEGMLSKIKKKTNTGVILFPNWVDTSFFFPITDQNTLKPRFGFASTDKIVLYSGAVGEKQGLTAILHAAKKLESQREVKFIICGTGPYKKKLEEKAHSMRLQNITFLDLRPKKEFNAFLNMADVHLLIQKEKASDLVMPSKLTSILAVGGLVVATANPRSYLYTVIKKHDMGLLVNAEDQEALNQGIMKALAMERGSEPTKNALKYANDFLSIDRIMESFSKVV